MELLPSRELRTSLDALHRRMGRVFGDLLSESFDTFGGARSWLPAVNVSETEEAIAVEAEVPGIDPEAVQISVSGNELTIRGEKSEEIEEEGRTWHRVERSHGAFTRSISLPAPVDADRVEARARNGVLQILLPKREEVLPRRITVRSE
jgi:HSP20 family protein